MQDLLDCLDRICSLNQELEHREQEITRLTLKTRRAMRPPPAAPPELAALLRLPEATLELELTASRAEYAALASGLDAALADSRRLAGELEGLGERTAAGTIYAATLAADLESAESEGEALAAELAWLVSLPPSAFASQEMLDWLRRDLLNTNNYEYDSDSELGLEISTVSAAAAAAAAAADPSSSGNSSSSLLLMPDQRHPVDAAATGNGGVKDIQTRSSSTGSTSSGVSSAADLSHSLGSPQPSLGKDDCPTGGGDSNGGISPPFLSDEIGGLTPPTHLIHHHNDNVGPPLLPPKRLAKIFGGGLGGSGGKEDDCNSDTGLSSLNSSAEDTYTFDTLV